MRSRRVLWVAVAVVCAAFGCKSDPAATASDSSADRTSPTPDGPAADLSATADGPQEAAADVLADSASDARTDDAGMDAGDAARDAAMDASGDVGSDGASDGPGADVRDTTIGDGGPLATRFTVPRTFQDDYFPEFHIDLAPADLTALLAMGSTARVPMTLRYMGESHAGTIRQRLGNNSTCGDRRQFRLDFPSHVTFPDGYRTDRFETDRGSCYVLHEWLSQRVLRRAATAHPELPLAFKYTNVVAIYFNDALYHVETLTEDANNDLMQRYEGTRNLTFTSGGCYTPPATGPVHTFCTTFDRPTLATVLDIPTYLMFAAVTKALVPGDNYPDTGYNWILVRNDDTGIFRPLADDWDEVPSLEPMPMADPFTVAHPDMDFQRHFTALLAETDLRARYRTDLGEARNAMDPTVMLPLLEMKYAQIRPTLARVMGVPFTMERVDFIYRTEVPGFFRDRYAFLGALP